MDTHAYKVAGTGSAWKALHFVWTGTQGRDVLVAFSAALATEKAEAKRSAEEGAEVHLGIYIATVRNGRLVGVAHKATAACDNLSEYPATAQQWLLSMAARAALKAAR